VQGSTSGFSSDTTIFSGATLELVNTDAEYVHFNGTNATLLLDAPSAFHGTVWMNVGGTIHLVGISASSATYSGTTLTINETNGQQLTYSVESADILLGDPHTVTDGYGGTLVYWGQLSTFNAPKVSISNAGGLTNQAIQTISGKVTTTEAAASATVTLFDNGTQIGTATLGAGGNWSTDVTLSGDGAHSLVAKDTDAAGNTGASSPVVFTLDTAAPTVSISNAGGVTHQAGQTINGTVTTTEAAAGATVTLYDNGSHIGTATLGTGGNWSTNVTLSGYGTHSIVAKDTDAAGNTGTSSPLVFNLEATPPVISLGELTIGAAGAITLNGTASSRAGIQSVVVENGAGTLGTATIGAGTWSYQGSLAGALDNLHATATGGDTETATAGLLSLSTLAFGASSVDASFTGAGIAGTTFAVDGGGFGHDTLSVSGTSVDLSHHSFTNWSSTDAVVMTASPTLASTLIAGNVATEMLAGAGNDSMYGGSGNNFLEGGAGNDLMYGGSGNDVLVAGFGSDIMIAGNGRDLFYGGPGLDYMYGGSGNDVFIGGTGLNIEEGNGGNDWFYLSDTNGSEAYGGSGNSTFIAGTGNTIMVGGSGNDTMFGGPGNDYFYGGSGNDEFFGGAGVDVMVANGAGNDYFDGGTGVNYYFGGKGGGPGTGLGHDTFVLKDTGATQSVDVVQDWTEGLDHVNLIGTGFTSFDDLLSHSYQNGAYFIVQPDANNAIWLNGATASTVTASDFSIVS
jgi:hypothetical protein